MTTRRMVLTKDIGNLLLIRRFYYGTERLLFEAMPLRCMGYDVREYERQAAVEKSRLRQWKKMKKRSFHGDINTESIEGQDSTVLTAAEFLSGFCKDSLLHPCITIVLYFGDKWDVANGLHQCVW